MAVDFFVKIDGVDGESSDKAHAKWIEALTVAHGAMQNISAQRGDIVGRGQFIPFKFTHRLDKATPKLQQFCMNGQKVATVEFQSCRAVAGVQVPVYEIKMENVKIARAEVTTIQNETTAEIVEEVELIAGKMTWKYTAIKPDGSKDGAIEAAFNQVENA
ncbi:MAG: type VI secretion system tube protein Hcp [Alphaproteobacteria bacterium]|nr:type VI secretion system tube protein Hcp [Alphaproteobacteria bacterium]